MADAPVIQTFSPLVAPDCQPYQSYLPTAFSDDLSLLQKVNYCINFLNTVTTTVNNALTQMNSVETWALGDGLTNDVDNQLNTWKNDGTLNTLINQTILGSKAAITVGATAPSSPDATTYWFYTTD